MLKLLSTLILAGQLCVCIVAAAYFLWSELEFRARAVEVPGRLIEARPVAGIQDAWQPVVEYSIGEPPQPIRITGLLVSRGAELPGTPVTVRIDPQEPAAGRIASFTESWGLVLLCLLLAAIHALSLWWKWRRAPAPAGRLPRPDAQNPDRPASAPAPEGLRAELRRINDQAPPVLSLILALLLTSLLPQAGHYAWTAIESIRGTVRVTGWINDNVSVRDADGQLMFQVVVRYRYGEGTAARTYELRGSHLSSRRSALGYEVPVYVRPDTPHAGIIGSFSELWAAPVFMGVLGSVGLGLLWWQLRGHWQRWRVARHLREHGVPIRARLIEVEYRWLIRVNGHSPWVIHASWGDPDRGRLHRFRSPQIWRDPQPALQRLGYVPMQVDRADPDRFHRFCVELLQ